MSATVTCFIVTLYLYFVGDHIRCANQNIEFQIGRKSTKICLVAESFRVKCLSTQHMFSQRVKLLIPISYFLGYLMVFVL